MFCCCCPCPFLPFALETQPKYGLVYSLCKGKLKKSLYWSCRQHSTFGFYCGVYRLLSQILKVYGPLVCLRFLQHLCDTSEPDADVDICEFSHYFFFSIKRIINTLDNNRVLWPRYVLGGTFYGRNINLSVLSGRQTITDDAVSKWTLGWQIVLVLTAVSSVGKATEPIRSL